MTARAKLRRKLLSLHRAVRAQARDEASEILACELFYSGANGLDGDEIDMLMLPSPDMSAMIESRERIERQIWEAFGFRRLRPTALAYRGGRFVVLEIDAADNAIEPPPRCPNCGPVLLCSKHAGF